MIYKSYKRYSEPLKINIVSKKEKAMKYLVIQDIQI